MKKIFRHWKIIYAVCSFIYMGWVIHAGGNEFDRINSQYRRLVKQLEPGHVKAAALEELAEECRREATNRINLQEDACSEWQPRVIEAKVQKVEERQQRARERGLVKLGLFYMGFVTIFLLAPVILLYLLISGVILLYKNITIVR